MRKTFQDLSVGDKLFKVHYDFKHNNFSIETKIIEEIKTIENGSKFLRGNEIVFVLIQELLDYHLMILTVN